MSAFILFVVLWGALVLQITFIATTTVSVSAFLPLFTHINRFHHRLVDHRDNDDRHNNHQKLNNRFKPTISDNHPTLRAFRFPPPRDKFFQQKATVEVNHNDDTNVKDRYKNNRNGRQRQRQLYKNDKNMPFHAVKVQATGNRILNPNHILFPSYYPYMNEVDSSSSSSSSSSANNSTKTMSMEYNREQVTLNHAMNELKKCLEKIVNFESFLLNSKGIEISYDDMDQLEFMLGSNDEMGILNIFDHCFIDGFECSPTDDNETNANGSIPFERQEHNNGNNEEKKIGNNDKNKLYTIRVEQAISHPVDPLCWLHANVESPKNRSMKQYQKVNDPVVLYMANAEKTMEAGIYGSTHTLHDLDDPASWDLVQNLPMGTRIYGGSRFDKTLHPDMVGEEWRDFGQELWFLPAIELRREKSFNFAEDNDDNDNGNDHFDHKEKENIESGNDVSMSSDEIQNQTNENDTVLNLETILSVNLHFTSPSELIQSAKKVLLLLNNLSERISPPLPNTTLPPILSRGYNNNAQEIFEKGVNSALDIFQYSQDTADDTLEKVVLARRCDLTFGTEVAGLDIMMKIKFGGSIGGHLFYMNSGIHTGKEFFGCAPERLFQVRGYDKMIISEALAGTRVRGSSAEEDAELLRDLINSKKDRNENMITGKFINNAFNNLRSKGFLQTSKHDQSYSIDGEGKFFVRRLRHLQHICQSFEGKMTSRNDIVDISKLLLKELHPTPAVCGFPATSGLEFIRRYETSSFDRGMYAGPFGFIGRDYADVVVAIRSGLLSQNRNERERSTLSIYAGAGVVQGSTAQGEWSETSYKLGVLSSFFAQSPLSFNSFPTANEAWAAAFIEELIRSGVTQFYICPGSRSTPLTAALSRAMRIHVGVVECTSVHDERAAAFRALGFARSTGQIAAVVTSSGTAVANLYPAVVESSMDGIPMILLTADRPYESRDIGANQAIDQLKIFSDTYVRWFRDISPPSDDVPISLTLADANHAAVVARELMGPVHLNIQFRENLAPESGPIRGDKRVDSIMSFSSNRFTDVPGFERWSRQGSKWIETYEYVPLNDKATRDVSTLISQSRRGIIVVGNIRNTNAKGGTSSSMGISALIAEFAKFTGLPILVGAQNAELRFHNQNSLVVPFAEHLLKHAVIKERLKPDLIIQIGSALISTEIQDIIYKIMESDSNAAHILLHSHRPTERANPSGTVTHVISSELQQFLPEVRGYLEENGFNEGALGSELIPLVQLGRELTLSMPSIIHEATSKVINDESKVWNVDKGDNKSTLSEPEITLALSEVLSEIDGYYQHDLFLSNSMPVRDSEFFLYPTSDYNKSGHKADKDLIGSVAVNRGASGIDGIISSATGFCEGTGSPTTLLVGDLASLHDINAFHHLSTRLKRNLPPLTTIIVNNNGGGIFSFLPIAKFGNDVGFEDFFGTPTDSFSFEKGAEAFGLPFRDASNFERLKSMYKEAILGNKPSIIEAKVVSREENVKIHKEISGMVGKLIDEILARNSSPNKKLHSIRIPSKSYNKNEIDIVSMNAEPESSKVLILLHGWMGDKDEWDEVAISLVEELPADWNILCVDLIGHGDTETLCSIRSSQLLNRMLSANVAIDDFVEDDLSLDSVAMTILHSLKKEYGLKHIDALAGYSLGGRIALAMKKISVNNHLDSCSLVADDTKLILLGSFPGSLDGSISNVKGDKGDDSEIRIQRKVKDNYLAREMLVMYEKSLLINNAQSQSKIWTHFLEKWYGNNDVWGGLERRQSRVYQEMVRKRLESLKNRAPDFAQVLDKCSPGQNSDDYWKYVSSNYTFFIAGELDKKYSKLGKLWTDVTYKEIPNAGHALLVESPRKVAEIINEILSEHTESSYDLGLRKLPDTKDDSLSSTFETKEDYSNNSLNETTFIKPGIFDMEQFVIQMSESENHKGVKGIGWGNKASLTNSRKGYLISLGSDDGRFVGIGEVSPLEGVHSESKNDAYHQLQLIKNALLESSNIPLMNCEAVLALEGDMETYIHEFITSLAIEKISSRNLLDSVRSGLEMAILALASESVRVPLPRSLLNQLENSLDAPTSLPINGLITRGINRDDLMTKKISYSSMKVKVGHRQLVDDAQIVIDTYAHSNSMWVRADANRGWNESSACAFVQELKQLDDNVVEKIEFIEEPLIKKIDEENKWTLSKQIEELEIWHKETGLMYALDESLADYVEQTRGTDFDVIAKNIQKYLYLSSGCAAFVLKPTLLGMELSMRLAKFAHEKLGIGVVFTSTFESGVGLAFTSFLATLSDTIAPKESRRYAHGISTFTFLHGDTLAPTFESYVREDGTVKIYSLGRAIYGLGIDELRDYFETVDEMEVISTHMPSNEKYQAMSSTSETGREINIQVSLSLPFSDDIACSRFNDLPQQSRWSPWLDNVSYLGEGETEWTLNVRGVEFRWKAVSAVLVSPKGIMWESTSGLKNKGRVEFVKVSDTSCLMNVRMTIRTPRIVATVFKTNGDFVKEFVENKLLKWSLESFRDVVKADLALERGDAELGDALYCAVEGRSNAIEATLSKEDFTK